jgi:hypothetical protein
VLLRQWLRDTRVKDPPRLDRTRKCRSLAGNGPDAGVHAQRSQGESQTEMRKRLGVQCRQ